MMNIYQFYVIILNNIVEQDRLPLPSSFLEELSNELEDYVTIRSRAGMCSTVIVEKSNDERLYLSGDRWVEFVARHSLSFGNFLLFKCKRPYYFKVFIFDQTATEIDYPTPDFDSQSSDVHFKFDKRMTASDITGRQTLVEKIGLRFVAVMKNAISLFVLNVRRKSAFHGIFVTVARKQPYALGDGNLL
ncbi:hypothetical protein ACFE04_020506 [Oxalis oulophora]